MADQSPDTQLDSEGLNEQNPQRSAGGCAHDSRVVTAASQQACCCPACQRIHPRQSQQRSTCTLMHPQLHTTPACMHAAVALEPRACLPLPPSIQHLSLTVSGHSGSTCEPAHVPLLHTTSAPHHKPPQSWQGRQCTAGSATCMAQLTRAQPPHSFPAAAHSSTHQHACMPCLMHREAALL